MDLDDTPPPQPQPRPHSHLTGDERWCYLLCPPDVARQLADDPQVHLVPMITAATQVLPPPPPLPAPPPALQQSTPHLNAAAEIWRAGPRPMRNHHDLINFYTLPPIFLGAHAHRHEYELSTALSPSDHVSPRLHTPGPSLNSGITDATAACATHMQLHGITRVDLRADTADLLLGRLERGLRALLSPAMFDARFQAEWAATSRAHRVLAEHESFKYEVSQQGAMRCTAMHLANLFVAHRAHWTPEAWAQISAARAVYADADQRSSAPGLAGSTADAVVAVVKAAHAGPGAHRVKAAGECKPKYSLAVARNVFDDANLSLRIDGLTGVAVHPRREAHNHIRDDTLKQVYAHFLSHRTRYVFVYSGDAVQLFHLAARNLVVFSPPIPANRGALNLDDAMEAETSPDAVPLRVRPTFMTLFVALAVVQLGDDNFQALVPAQGAVAGATRAQRAAAEAAGQLDARRDHAPRDAARAPPPEMDGDGDGRAPGDRPMDREAPPSKPAGASSGIQPWPMPTLTPRERPPRGVESLDLAQTSTDTSGLEASPSSPPLPAFRAYSALSLNIDLVRSPPVTLSTLDVLHPLPGAFEGGPALRLTNDVEQARMMLGDGGLVGVVGPRLGYGRTWDVYECDLYGLGDGGAASACQDEDDESAGTGRGTDSPDTSLSLPALSTTLSSEPSPTQPPKRTALKIANLSTAARVVHHVADQSEPDLVRQAADHELATYARLAHAPAVEGMVPILYGAWESSEGVRAMVLERVGEACEDELVREDTSMALLGLICATLWSAGIVHGDLQLRHLRHAPLDLPRPDSWARRERLADLARDITHAPTRATAHASATASGSGTSGSWLRLIDFDGAVLLDDSLPPDADGRILAHGAGGVVGMDAWVRAREQERAILRQFMVEW